MCYVLPNGAGEAQKASIERAKLWFVTLPRTVTLGAEPAQGTLI